MSAATLQALIGAAAIACALSALGPALDAGPDHEPPTQAELVARAVAASRAADVAQCQAQHGENATAVHLPDGQHRCADKHGRRLLQKVATR